MMMIPHALVGGALGSLFPATPLGMVGAFGAGLVSHYALDGLPHWERLFGFHDNLPYRKIPHHLWPGNTIVQAGLDGLFSILILIVVVNIFGHHPFVWQDPIFWGGLGGAFPDFFDHVPLIQNYLGHSKLFGRFNKLHKRFHISIDKQHSAPKYLGLITQLLAIGASVGILVAVR